MYAIVKYNDYLKEQHFEVIRTTDDVEYAKKFAFQLAKKLLSSYKDTCCVYKIANKNENLYLYPVNETIVAYNINKLIKYKNKFKLVTTFSTVYAVIKMKPVSESADVEEIDTTLICDDYFEHDYEDEDD